MDHVFNPIVEGSIALMCCELMQDVDFFFRRHSYVEILQECAQS